MIAEENKELNYASTWEQNQDAVNSVMMSQYDLPYESDSWVSDALELSIETLAGRAFEIRVLPTDTIISIKSKIQRVEGIPVSQQHLLYNEEELDNNASVGDYPIQNGSTLRLVLSIRGGPISTRRLPPVNDLALKWRETHEFINRHKEDFIDLESLPSRESRVKMLVYREGNQVNLFRVMENDDGTYSPLSESMSGTSLRNLFTEEDPEEFAKKLKENSKTMGKMQELKEKLELLSLQRKKKGNRKYSNDEDAETADRKLLLDDTNRMLLDEPETGSRLTEIAQGQLESHMLENTATQESPFQFLSRPLLPEVGKRKLVRPRRRLVSCTKTNAPGQAKARKDAGEIIRIQSKTLNVVVGPDELHPIGPKRTPLPEIRSSPVGAEDETCQAAGRLQQSNFAVLDTENDSNSASSVCSSRGSVVSLPSSQVAITVSPRQRNRVSPSLIHYPGVSGLIELLKRDIQPRTSPCNRLESRRQIDMMTRQQEVEADIEEQTSDDVTNSDLLKEDLEKYVDLCHEPCGLAPIKSIQTTDKAVHRKSNHIAQYADAVPMKRKQRCSKCSKRLNITNIYTCRCSSIFCSSHRHSEVHDCPFDYKEEGRKLLQKANPLLTAPKLPEI